MDSWLEYWNGSNKIYVSRRHQEAHYATLFAGVMPYLPSGLDRVMLDWGCGDALAAPRMAARCNILLFDAAENTREPLRGRYRDHPNIRTVDKAGVDDLKSESIDFILVNSVIQYFSRAQFERQLKVFYHLLKSDGALLIGDVIDPKSRLADHIKTFLVFAWRERFFAAALSGLALTFLSPYRKLEQNVGISRYTEAEMIAILDKAGFSGERLPSNIAVSKVRSSYLARRRELVGTAGSAVAR